MRILLFLIFIASLWGPQAVSAQSKSDNHIIKLIKNDRFTDALSSIETRKKKDKDYFYFRGVTMYFLNRLDEAVADLTTSYEKGKEDKTVLYYLGRSHQKKGEFVLASRAFKLYLNELSKKDPERREIIDEIKKCAYALKSPYRDQQGFVENLGSSVNTIQDEISPIPSPNYADKYYFSSNRPGSTGGMRNKKGLKDNTYGNHYHDIYTVENINGNWTPSTGVPPLLNSSRNDVIQSFTDNGRVLFFLKEGGEQPSSILSDTFTVDVNSYPQGLSSPANGSLGDQDVFFVNDSTFLFSSKRKGGYGGLDIYITQKRNGIWIEPENLGPSVNSAYDERTPFLVNSGNIIYFSSNRKESLGGYDIFYAFYGIERARWEGAKNIGLPISSPADDLGFKLNQDGRSAVLYSNRKESIGGYDIFVAYLKNQVEEQASYSSTIPFLDNPVDLAGYTIPEESTDTTTVAEATEEFIEPSIEAAKETSIIEREIVVSPLFYNSTDNLLTPTNLNNLKNILDMMIIYPELRMTLTGSSLNEGSRSYELYFSIKRAEVIAKYFYDNGIDPSRIQLKGVGSSYPIAKQLGSTVSKKNNQRVDVLLSNLPENGLIVSYTYPVIAEYLKDPSFPEYQEKSSGLSYRIEVARVKQLYDNETVFKYKDIMVQKDGNSNEYVYTVGIFQDYFSARAIKNELIRNGMLDIHLEAYVDEDRIKDKDVLGVSETHADLLDYHKYEIE